MDLTRKGFRVAAGACALTLLFAACGGDDDDSSDGDDSEQTTESTESEPAETSASEPEETTTTTTDDEGEGDGEGDPEAVATAEAINLTIEDFAEGWVEEEDEEGGTDDDFDECFSSVDIEGTTLGEAETPGFTVETPDGAGAQAVSMQTVVFDSADSATAALAEMATPEFAECLKASLTEDADEGTSAELTPETGQQLAEESVGLVGTVQIPTPDGATQEGQLDLRAIRTAEVVSFTFTLDIGATPETGFEQTKAELYQVIVDRQAAEVG